MMLFMSGWYFMIFQSRVSMANLSLQYVNLMNCMVISGAIPHIVLQNISKTLIWILTR